MTSSDNATGAEIVSPVKLLLTAGITPTVLLAVGISSAVLMTGCGTDTEPPPPAESSPPVDAGESIQYAPLPDHVRAPEIPSKGYLLDDLTGGLYGIRDGNSSSMFLVTSAGVVVVDAGDPRFSPGRYVMQAIREVTDLPITHFVYSHPHADHVGGASMFESANVSGTKPQYIAHELTAERLRRANDPRRPIPTQTFAGSQYVLEVGGEQLVLDYHGDLHSAGDLFIYAPKQKVLMLVDVIAPRWAPYFKLGHTPNVPLYLEVAEQILEYDFETFIGGHVGWYGTRADVEEIGRYFVDLEAAARQALAENDVDYEGIDPDNSWALSQTFYEGLALRAAELMPASWLTRLGGADVFLKDNAHSMVYSLVTDFASPTP